MAHPLSRRIADVLDLDPAAPAIQYEGQWFTWGQLGEFARTISALVAQHTGGAHPRVGIMLRNRPAHVAALLGVLLAGGTVVVINPSRGDDRTRADIDALQLPRDHRRTRRHRHARDTVTRHHGADNHRPRHSTRRSRRALRPVKPMPAVPVSRCGC